MTISDRILSEGAKKNIQEYANNSTWQEADDWLTRKQKHRDTRSRNIQMKSAEPYPGTLVPTVWDYECHDSDEEDKTLTTEELSIHTPPASPGLIKRIYSAPEDKQMFEKKAAWLEECYKKAGFDGFYATHELATITYIVKSNYANDRQALLVLQEENEYEGNRD
jgi:hypothetical protein